MLKIYSSQGTMMAYHVKNLLEQSDIRCAIRGEELSGAAGGVAPIDAWIEVWILDERQHEEAREIVDTVIQDLSETAESWKCPKCGETIEGSFSQCWQCGTECG